MFKKFALCVVALALALALPAGTAFAAKSTGGNAPELTAQADTTAATVTAQANAEAGDEADPAEAPATSPATGAMLMAVAAGTVVCVGGAGAAANRLRKQQ